METFPLLFVDGLEIIFLILQYKRPLGKESAQTINVWKVVLLAQQLRW